MHIRDKHWIDNLLTSEDRLQLEYSHIFKNEVDCNILFIEEFLNLNRVPTSFSKEFLTEIFRLMVPRIIEKFMGEVVEYLLEYRYRNTLEVLDLAYIALTHPEKLTYPSFTLLSYLGNHDFSSEETLYDIIVDKTIRYNKYFCHTNHVTTDLRSINLFTRGIKTLTGCNLIDVMNEYMEIEDNMIENIDISYEPKSTGGWTPYDRSNR